MTHNHLETGSVITAAIYGFFATLLSNPSVRGVLISLFVAFASGFCAKAGAYIFKRVSGDK